MLLLAGSSALVIASESTNLISNGSFESGETTGWTLEVKKDSGAVATRILDSTSGTAKEGKIFHRTQVTAAPSDPASNNWHVQLKDPSYAVRAGYNYHFSMWARGDASHKVQFSIYGKNGTFITCGAPFNITNEWAQYHMVYKSDVEGGDAINFAVVYGFETGSYDIDNVVITEEAADDNMYSNGGFELGDAGWTLNINSSDSGQATMVIKSDSAHSGKNYCRINVTKIPTENWMIQLSDDSWTSELNAEYTFSFWARSDIDYANIQLAINAGSAHNYAYLRGTTYSPGKEWTEYSTTFTITDDSLAGKDAISFNIYCGTALGNFDFDDIKLVKNVVSVKKTVALENRISSQIKVNVLPDQIQCRLNSSENVNKISMFNIQGKAFYMNHTGNVVNGNFNLPRPPSGSWIINVATDHSNISKTIVLP
jgi:hypothetical protein